MPHLGVVIVAPTEAPDMSTTTGRAMAGMPAAFAARERKTLRERIRAGIAQAGREGRGQCRPRTASLNGDEVRRLKAERLSRSKVARRLGIGQTSAR